VSFKYPKRRHGELGKNWADESKTSERDLLRGEKVSQLS
jgi:hypothetical protein